MLKNKGFSYKKPLFFNKFGLFYTVFTPYFTLFRPENALDYGNFRLNSAFIQH